MNQLILAVAEYAIKKRKTRQYMLLRTLGVLLPLKQLEVAIARHYDRGGMSSPRHLLSTMPWVRILQLVYKPGAMAVKMFSTRFRLNGVFDHPPGSRAA